MELGYSILTGLPGFLFKSVSEDKITCNTTTIYIDNPLLPCKNSGYRVFNYPMSRWKDMLLTKENPADSGKKWEKRKFQRIEMLTSLQLPLEKAALNDMLDAVGILKRRLKEDPDIQYPIAFRVESNNISGFLQIYDRLDRQGKEIFLFFPLKNKKGHYIEKGSFKKVFKGWLLTKKPKCIAVGISDLGSDNIKSACMEAKFLQELRGHTNILKLFKTVYFYINKKKDVQQFLIMKYYSPFELFGNCASLSDRGKLQLAIDLLNAVQYMHHHNIVHRDIKFDNILFDKRQQPVLCDLGKACLTNDQEQLKEPEGTFDYLPIESLLKYYGSIENKPLSVEEAKALDIWSLGCVFWKVFSNHRFPWFDIFDQNKEKSSIEEMLAVIREFQLHRPAKPLPLLIWEMLNENPLKRPKIDELIGKLSGMLKDLPEGDHRTFASQFTTKEDQSSGKT